MEWSESLSGAGGGQDRTGRRDEVAASSRSSHRRLVHPPSTRRREGDAPSRTRRAGGLPTPGQWEDRSPEPRPRAQVWAWIGEAALASRSPRRPRRRLRDRPPPSRRRGGRRPSLLPPGGRSPAPRRQADRRRAGGVERAGRGAKSWVSRHRRGCVAASPSSRATVAPVRSSWLRWSAATARGERP